MNTFQGLNSIYNARKVAEDLHKAAEAKEALFYAISIFHQSGDEVAPNGEIQPQTVLNVREAHTAYLEAISKPYMDVIADCSEVGILTSLNLIE